MPRGKVIAQASHALSSFVLGSFDFNNSKFRQEKLIDSLCKEISSVKIVGVDDNDFESENFLIKIEDHGRTVFKGVPTVTCGLICSDELKDKFQYNENAFEKSDEAELSIRLVHLVNKQYARKDFDKAITDCVVLQSLHLIKVMQKDYIVKSQDFLSWAKGSFGKIVLVSDEEFIKDFQSKESDMGIDIPISFDSQNSCVVGPVNKVKMDDYTKFLKMM